MADEITKSFARIAGIIETARENTFQKVNEELIRMYWNVGEFLSGESQSASFGDAYIDSVADFIQQEFPGIRGFTRRGLYRMKRFYEIYKDDEFVTTLLTQVSWSNHLAIISKSKTEEERHFYLMLSIKERYTARELQRQIDSAYYERYMLSKDKIKPETVAKEGTVPFLDTYVLDFLTLPKNYKEKDLKKAILNNLKDFILEVGRDFTFIDEEYKVEVGNRDFFIDLLFSTGGYPAL